MRYGLKKRIAKSEIVLGCFLNYYAPALVETLGMAGYDYLLLDNEHGAFSPHEMESMIRAADSAGLATVVRVDYDVSAIQKALDMGAEGIQVPKVNTAEEARAVVRRAKYPPLGDRGIGFSCRSARLSAEKGAEYIRRANEDTLVVVQIETPQAIENLDEILGVPGLDVAFLGLMDLSLSVGCPGDLAAPALTGLERRFHEAVLRHSMVSGLVVPMDVSFESLPERTTLYAATAIGEVTSRLAATAKALKEFRVSQEKERSDREVEHDV
jgi:4-hydroxy-2-oxoheptanedioate aldolase